MWPATSVPDIGTMQTTFLSNQAAADHAAFLRADADRRRMLRRLVRRNRRAAAGCAT